MLGLLQDVRAGQLVAADQTAAPGCAPQHHSGRRELKEREQLLTGSLHVKHQR